MEASSIFDVPVLEGAVSEGPPEQDIPPLARSPEEWDALLARHGERSFRAQQILNWIYRRGVADPIEMTNLPTPLRSWLVSQGLGDPVETIELRRSPDGARKLVLDLRDSAKIECVLIPMLRQEPPAAAFMAAGAVDEDEDVGVPGRMTLCISTQYGCSMGCSFCASGRFGLGRSLRAEEILAQVLAARRQLQTGEMLRNIVVMGMGEPMANYAETARALHLLIHPAGGAISPRRITVSTVGLIPGIVRLGRDFSGKIGLAVSLHAPDDETRQRLVPASRRYPIASLCQALRQYPLPPRRRITIEYTLIDGINDHIDQARRLAMLLRGLRVKINLIPLNRIATSPWQPPSPERIFAFRDTLAQLGYSCFVRASRGDDVAAACGQLGLTRG